MRNNTLAVEAHWAKVGFADGWDSDSGVRI